MIPILVLLGAYLLGAIPFGYVLVKWKTGADVRSAGSGNIGATNVLRTTGRAAGIATLVLDIAKGYLAVCMAGRLTAHDWLWMSAAALAVMAGHAYAVFLKFKGGKAVATTFGVVAVLAPWAALNLVAVYILALWQTRTFSVSALICAWLLPVAVGLFSDSKAYLLLAGVLSGLVLVCHRENLERFFKGEEPRL